MSDKKQKKLNKAHQKESSNNTNRGKPSGIQDTTLQTPNIWTNDQSCLRLIKYLQDYGRHICLHQAGKPNQDNKYKASKSEIEITRAYYELAEKFANELFGHKCETKRCIVFFFRSSEEEKSNNYDWIRQYKLDCEEVLIKVSALFSHKFFQELIAILTFNGQIHQLIEQFLMNGKTPQSYSHIIQNIYIKNMIDSMKCKNSKQDYELKNRGDMEQNFYNFIQSQDAKDKLEKFIKEIKFIFNRENDQYEPQDFEKVQEIEDLAENQDMFSYLQEGIDFPRESNQFILVSEF